MPVTQSDVFFRLSEDVSDTPGANGGVFAIASIPDFIRDNVFPSVTQAERITGKVRWRKVFVKLENADDAALFNSKFFLTTMTSAGDYCHFADAASLGNYQTDVQSLAESSWRGAGGVTLAVAGGVSSSVRLTVENATQDGFDAPGLARITDGVSEEFFDYSSITSVSGTSLFLVRSSGTFTNSYPVGSVVSAVGTLGAGTLQSQVGSYSYSTAGGSLETDAVSVNNQGARKDTWTLTFTGAQTFQAVGTDFGVVGYGNVAQNYTALDGQGKTLFYIPSAKWSGSFLASEYVRFMTDPAAWPVWLRETVPAGSAGHSGNILGLGVYGESA